MVGTDDLLIWKDIGIGAVGIVVFYKFATKVTDNAAKQMTQLHTSFLEAYKENTKVMSELVSEFHNHIKMKDQAIQALRDCIEKLERKYEQKS